VKKCGKIEVGGGPSRAADAAGTVVPETMPSTSVVMSTTVPIVENAKKEIAFWFKEGEVQTYKSA
jgi:hypothetical protein